MILPFIKSVDAVVTFVHLNDLLLFLMKISNEQIMLFVAVSRAQSTLECVHDLQQIEVIFLVGDTNEIERQQFASWKKIQDLSQIDRFVAEASVEKQRLQSLRSCWNRNQSMELLNHVPPSFMLTQLLTEIVIKMEDDDGKAKQEYLTYARHRYKNDQCRLKDLKRFEDNYSSEDAICWYTKYSLIYTDVNVALRSGNIRDILMMRLIIRYMSHRLRQLYQPPQQSTTFYRGQCLSCSDFEQLRLRIGGLYSFNYFLSTSRFPEVARGYATASCCSEDATNVGILFEIHSDPQASKWTTFTRIDRDSHFGEAEMEVLFSTNSIFRVGRIDQLGKRLWKVNLFSTTDHDAELQRLAQVIRSAAEGSNEWERIGKILFNLGLIHTSKEVLDIMIENLQKDSSSDPGHREHLIGVREQVHGNYDRALAHFRRSLGYHQHDSKVTDQALINIHRDLGSTYQKLNEYQQAERSFRKALQLQEQIVPTNYVGLLSLFQPLANVLEALKLYSERLKIDEKILDLRQNKILDNELELEEIYRCIARDHYRLKDYQLCLEKLKKICDLRRTCTELTDRRSCLLQVLIDDLEKEVSSPSIGVELIQQQLEFRRNELKQLKSKYSTDVIALAKCYDALGQLYSQMRDYSTALKWYQMMLQCIQRKSSMRSISLASTYDRIGQIYDKLGNYLEASLFYRKAITLATKSPSDDTTSLKLYRVHLKRVGKLPDYFDDQLYYESSRSY